MKETNLNDWKIIRNEPYELGQTDFIYESDDSAFAFYFSQDVEWSIMKYCAKLQIYKNKGNPIKIYDSKSAWFLFNFNITDFIYDWTTEKIICFRQLINHGSNNYSYPFVVINLETLTYSVIKDKLFAKPTYNNVSTISMTETIINPITKSEKIVTEQFHFNQMKWVPLME